MSPPCPKKRGTFVAHNLMLHAKWETTPYLLLPIWTKRCMDFEHLPTHVPFAIFNQFDGGKKMCRHFIGAYMNNPVFKRPCHNIGSTIGLTHPIGHGVQT
jgi:hypothetical protein